MARPLSFKYLNSARSNNQMVYIMRCKPTFAELKLRIYKKIDTTEHIIPCNGLYSSRYTVLTHI